MPLPTAQKMTAIGATCAAIAAFTYFKMVYVVPDGHIGLLYNSATDSIENYVMHPGSHIRFSWNENPVFLKSENTYKRLVTNVSTADKVSRKQTESNVDALVKVQYKLNVKDSPVLYSGYGNEETYKNEVFLEPTDVCTNSILSRFKYEELQKGLASKDRYLQEEFSKCLAKETAQRYISVEWAQLVSVSKREAH